MKHCYRFKIYFSKNGEDLKVSLTPKFEFEIECDPDDKESWLRYCELDSHIISLCHSLKDLFDGVRCSCTDEIITYYS